MSRIIRDRVLVQGPPGLDGIGVLTDGAINLAATTITGTIARIDAQVFDVTRYGAAGDGVTDDTAAINAAIAAAIGAGGGNVFFPSGIYLVAPTTTAWLQLASNLTYSGNGYSSHIKVKANAGNYSSVFRPPTVGARVENVTFRDLRIDQDAAVQTIATAPLGAGILNCQFAVAAWNARNIAVERCWFDTCSGVNTIYVNGDGFTDVTDVRVEGCHFAWLPLPNATNPDTTHRTYDNSAVYIVAGTATVSGNHFVGIPEDGPRGCCEFHGPHMTYINNHSYGYQTLINLGTLALSANDIANWVVKGNTGYQLNNAIAIVSPSGGHTNNVVIEGNILHHDTVRHNLRTGWAIAMGGDPAVAGSFARLDIIHNLISYEPDARTTDWTGTNLVSVANGDYFTGIYMACAVGSVVSIGRVSWNTIVNAPSHGLTIGAQSAGAVKHVEVAGNLIVDCGRMRSWYASSPAYVNLQGTITDVWVRDNTIIDNGVSSAIGYFSYRAAAAINLFAGTRVRVDEGPILGVGAPLLQTWGYAPAEIERQIVRAVIDPPSIAAGTEWTTTVVMLGVAADDVVVATPGNGIENGLSFYVFVSAPNQITLSVRNYTGGAIDADSRTWRFRLHRTELDV